MRDDEILTGTLIEDSWITLEQAAMLCAVDSDWLLRHIDEGLLPQAASVAGVWRFTTATIRRARRMRRLERDFDAVPELAALMADALEELDRQRRWTT